MATLDCKPRTFSLTYIGPTIKVLLFGIILWLHESDMLSAQLKWETGPWRKCSVQNCTMPGTRKRTVDCRHDNQSMAERSSCLHYFGYEPASEELCLSPLCIKEYESIASFLYGSWSDCSIPAYGSEHDLHRFSGPGNSSTDVAATSKPKSSDLNVKSNASCYTRVTYVRTRRVQCILKFPLRNISMALSESEWQQYVPKMAQNVPARVQACYKACLPRCSVTLWSSWQSCTPCTDRGTHYRTRSRASYSPPHSPTNCPDILELRQSTFINKDLHNLYQYRIGAWSEIGEVEKTNRNDQPVNDAPTFMINYRNTTCVEQSGNEVSLTNCLNVSVVASMQANVRKVDCSLTDWSPWSACQPHVSMSAGVRVRRRYVRATPLDGGESCAHLAEIKTCDTSSGPEENRETFRWFVGNWSECKLLNDFYPMQNAVLFKERSVFCVAENDTSLQEVEPRYCGALRKPTQMDICDVGHHLPCLYAPWSAWDASLAQGSGHLIWLLRRRDLVSGNSEICQHIVEGQACPIGRCFEWLLLPSSSCVLENPHRVCGEGRFRHQYACTNLFGDFVHDSFCAGNPSSNVTDSCVIPCPGDCVVSSWERWSSCDSGIRRRIRHIISIGGESSRACPTLTEHESCLDMRQKPCFWRVTMWSECMLNSSINSSNCFNGVQIRNVSCVASDLYDVVDEANCYADLKPRTVNPCQECRSECVLSSWSAWRPRCPLQCSLTSASYLTMRKRFVIQYGFNCPNQSGLIEERYCTSCASYAWKAKEWSTCLHSAMPVHGPSASTLLQNGIQIRPVICSNGLDMVDEEYCLRGALAKPDQVRECQINWLASCNLKPWSSWSECSRKCGQGVSFRRRDFGTPNCQNKQNGLNLYEERRCNVQPCIEYRIQAGPWGLCHPLVAPQLCASQLHANLGVQWRNVSCIRNDGSQVAMELCKESDLEDDRHLLGGQKGCVVPCKRDCQLSEWSKFTPCSQRCGSGTQVRFRRILRNRANGGRPCPEATKDNVEIQTINCRIEECSDYGWAAGPWSQCNVVKGLQQDVSCGTGYQTREVFCTKATLQPFGKSNISFCDSRERPHHIKDCEVFCSDDCVVSCWSEWDSCSAPCMQTGKRRRTRHILRERTSSGKDCADLIELENCNGTCTTFVWKATQWSSCLVNNDLSSCGIGIRRRLADCVTSEGKSVSAMHCRDSQVPILLEKCQVPCPVDCELSLWTEWSACSMDCDTVSYKDRHRVIVRDATYGGDPCSHHNSLREALLCPMLPCYSLQVGQWGPCIADVQSACGYGQRNRSVSCLRSDGNIVDENFCLDFVLGRVSKVETCEIPCWSDCIVSEWSEWGACFGVCDESSSLLASKGASTRDRAVVQNATSKGSPCPSLYESRVCENPECHKFSWVERGNLDKDSSANLCLRSDGLYVTGGCEPKSVPSSTGNCKCTSPHALCNQKQECVCQEHFYPTYDEAGQLLDCFMRRSKSSVDLGRTNRTTLVQPKVVSELPLVIWIVCFVIFAYGLLFIGFMATYMRRRKRLLLRRQALVNQGSEVHLAKEDEEAIPMQALGAYRSYRPSEDSAGSSGISSGGGSFTEDEWTPGGGTCGEEVQMIGYELSEREHGCVPVSKCILK